MTFPPKMSLLLLHRQTAALDSCHAIFDVADDPAGQDQHAATYFADACILKTLGGCMVWMAELVTLGRSGGGGEGPGGLLGGSMHEEEAALRVLHLQPARG